MFELFKAKAEVASAEVHRFPARDQAMDFIKETFRKEGVADASGAYAVWTDCPFLSGVDKNAMAREFPGLHFDVTRDLAEKSKIGLSQMQWGLADTGTVAQNSTDPRERLVSMLPWMHIAILETSRILPNMTAFFESVRPEENAYLAFITGPSRTADIERVLTIGVHGPERLIVVLVDDMGGQN